MLWSFIEWKLEKIPKQQMNDIEYNGENVKDNIVKEEVRDDAFNDIVEEDIFSRTIRKGCVLKAIKLIYVYYTNINVHSFWVKDYALLIGAGNN